MNIALRCIFFGLSIHLIFCDTAQALPDMTSDQVNAWFRQNSLINSLRLTKKYEPDMSDFDSSTKMKDGTVNLTIFLDRQKYVETETIDYRPNCYYSSDCYGTIRFEKASLSNGHNLIKAVWNQEILDDFKSSTLVESYSGMGTKRWYHGSLYNYETWHYNNYTIAHFTVVSKQVSISKRIARYVYCAKKSC